MCLRSTSCSSVITGDGYTLTPWAFRLCVRILPLAPLNYERFSLPAQGFCSVPWSCEPLVCTASPGGRTQDGPRSPADHLGWGARPADVVLQFAFRNQDANRRGHLLALFTACY